VPENNDKSALLVLQFGPYRTDITTFFLLHCESRKQQFWLSSSIPFLWLLLPSSDHAMRLSIQNERDILETSLW